jgi:hypothetical protein
MVDGGGGGGVSARAGGEMSARGSPTVTKDGMGSCSRSCSGVIVMSWRSVVGGWMMPPETRRSTAGGSVATLGSWNGCGATGCGNTDAGSIAIG